MSGKPLLYVGLDYDDTAQALEFARELNEVPRDGFGFKTNLDGVIWEGLRNPESSTRKIIATGRPSFIDFKMWNGGRTMSNVARQCADVGVDLINMYAGHAGEKFIGQVVRAVEGSKTKVFGLTVLSHYTDADCQRIYGCSLKDAVRKLADIAYNGGCHGIIAPGTALDVIQHIPLPKLVPAARPRWYGKTGENSQEQESYIDDAIRAGADFLVCSTPIRKSSDRKAALIRTLDEMVAAASERS